MIKSRGILQLAQLAVAFCFVALMTLVLRPSYTHAVGIYKDEFWPVPRRSDEGTIFAVPEIMVGLKDLLSSHFGSLEVYRVERWERILGNRGYIVGFMKRSESGKLKMCACTKYSSILSSAVQSEIDLKRELHPEKLTDFEDMELDKKIESDCLNAGTFHECVDFNSIVPSPPAYCNAFYRDLDRKVVPLAFNKQSYFDPGLRMMQKMPSDAGNGRYFGASDVYIGEYDGYAAGKRDRGQTRFICPTGGMITALTKGATAFDVVHSECDIPDASATITGYAVIKRGEEVCLTHRHGGVFVSDCVPSPSLSSPTVQAASNGLRIRFSNCQNRYGKESKYCDFTMANGDRDATFGFSVIKPKLDIDRYSLKIIHRCLDNPRDKRLCRNFVPEIVEDPDGNVTCFISSEEENSLFFVRRGHRYHWLRELPKVLVAFGYDPISRRKLQCGDEKSIDLAQLTQKELDTMRVKGRSFSFPEGLGGNGIHDGILCQGRLTYSYTNRRAFLHDGSCASAAKDGVMRGHCSTKYESLDNFEKEFLRESEFPSAKSVVPLNPILQGHCVSNFPSHEYKVTNQKGASPPGKIQRSYTLEISRHNTTCDLLKIEMWGGGESGSLHTGRAGRNGEYVLGILRLNLKPQEQKFLKINVGVGGSADIKKKGGGNDAGATTEVFLCDSDGAGGSCPMKLFAKGGGQKAVSVPEGLGMLAHYRVFEGLATLRGQDKVFIPYQNPRRYEGYAAASEVGCERGSTAMSAGIKTVPSSDVFPGAGGCARADINVLQGGANGMVKISCEKWSGPAGHVRLWEQQVACNKKSQEALEELADHHRMFFYSGETASILNLLSSRQVCGAVSQAPSFVVEVEKVLDFVKAAVYEQVATQQLIDEEVKTLQKDFDAALGREPGLLSYLTAVMDEGATVLSEQAVRAKLNAAFAEVLRKKSEVFISIADLRKITAIIANATANKLLKTTIEMISARDHVESFARDGHAVKTLKSIADIVNSVNLISYYTEELRQRSVNRYVSDFKSMIRKRKKFAQKLEARLGQAANNGKPFDDARLEAVARQSAEAIRRFIVRKSEVLTPREGALLKKLVILRDASKGLDAISRRVFSKIGGVSFTRSTLGSKRFVSEVERAVSLLEGQQGPAKSPNEIAAEIENAMQFLRQALDAEPEVTKAYIEVVEYRNTSGHVFSRDDLIEAFRKIYKKHYGVRK